MKNKLHTIATAGMMLLFSGWAVAQLSLTGEIRPRTEYRNGYGTLIDSAQNPGIFTSQRTRLNFGYSNEKIKTGVVLQDVRVWGNQSTLNKYDVNTYGLHEGWAEYLFNKRFSVKAGRQEISYDDERLLGGVAWQQHGRSHDAMVFKYADSTFTAHFGGAYNQTGENSIATAYTGFTNYKEMYYIWLNKKIKSFNISILEFNNGAQSPVSTISTRFSYTAGLHLEYKKDALFGSLRYYNQGGVDAGFKDIQAYMFGFDLQYTLKKKFMVGIGGEMLSGQSQVDTATAYKKITHNFNALYGTGHKFNGFMDYYFAGSAHGNVGLNDFYLKTRYKAEKWWIALDIHQFMANADVLDKKELTTNGKYKAMNAGLGTEIDLTFAYIFNPAFTAQFGYSHMMATETTEALKGGKYDETQNWAYLMLIFKPNFMK